VPRGNKGSTCNFLQSSSIFALESCPNPNIHIFFFNIVIIIGFSSTYPIQIARSQLLFQSFTIQTTIFFVSILIIMFTRVFGKPKQDTSSNALATLDKLNEVLLFLIHIHTPFFLYFHMCISIINQFNCFTWFSYNLSVSQLLHVCFDWLIFELMQNQLMQINRILCIIHKFVKLVYEDTIFVSQNLWMNIKVYLFA